MKHYVALFDSDWNGENYNRGDIVIAKSGACPPAIAWAIFEPPAELSGTPVLAHIADDGSGDLIFRYSLPESEIGFILKVRVGLPEAVVVIEQNKKSPARDSSPPEREGKPVLEYGAGIATTESRSYVGWAPGGSRPGPRPKVEEDLLHPPDDGIDWLRRGME